MSRVLVVDDDAMTLKMVEHILTGGGHEVVSTSNPEDVAFLAASHGVDAVILDVMMPGRSGLEVLRDIQNSPSTKQVPVLMLSALDEAGDRVKGLRGGADDYLGKPFDPEELLLRLNRLIDAQRAVRAEFQGRLETLGLSEVVQSLINSGRSGVLEIVAGDRRGQIVLSGEGPHSAAWGRLKGREAILTMIDLETGSFTFDEGPVSSGGGALPPIEGMMLDAAWLVDEASRWPEILRESRLSVPVNAVAPSFTDVGWGMVPLDAVFATIRKNPGSTLDELIDLGEWAPKKVVLAVRFLVYHGLVVATAMTAAADPSGDDDARIRDTVQALVEAAGSESGDDMPKVLVVLDPGAYGAFLEARQGLSSDLLIDSGQSLTAAWSGGRVATLAFRADSAGLVMHVVSSLSKEALTQIASRIDNYVAALVLVGRAESVGEIARIVAAVEGAEGCRRGAIVAVDPGARRAVEEAVETAARWRLDDRRVESFADMFETLSAACS